MHRYVLSFVQSGARGVQLFYLISAFTLCYSYSNRSIQDKYPLVSFYIRRFFRIAPLYYLAVIFYLWLYGLGPRYWLGDAATITCNNIASNFFFLHGINPYWINSIVPGGWSVSTEMLFYAMFPLIFNSIKNANNACGFVLLSILIKGLFVLALRNHPLIADHRLWGEFLFLSFPNQLPIFALGILLYQLITNGHAPAVSKFYYFCAFALFYFNFITKGDRLNLQLETFTVAFMVLAFMLKKTNTPFVFNKAVYFIGDLSYSLYLVHFGVIYFLSKHTIFDAIHNQTAVSPYLNFVYNLVVGVACSVFAATALHFLIEKPALKLGRKLVSQINNPRG